METSYVIFLGLPKRGNQSIQCELTKHFMASSSILSLYGSLQGVPARMGCLKTHEFYPCG